MGKMGTDSDLLTHECFAEEESDESAGGATCDL